jgi:sulfur-oxidizing protein SoxB
MNLTKREFLQVLARPMAGMGLGRYADADAATAANRPVRHPQVRQRVFPAHDRLPRAAQADLLPRAQRQPGHGSMQGQLPHLVGEHLLKVAKVRPGTAEAHALTYLDFDQAAKRYGKVGGFAHLATLVKRMKASRPGALLLDGGDTWQGRPPRCGPMARTWSTPASCWAWT